MASSGIQDPLPPSGRRPKENRWGEGPFRRRPQTTGVRVVLHLAALAVQHGLEAAALQAFVKTTMRRMIFDGEQLSELLAPLDLGWKARAQKEQDLMTDLIPLLHKLAQGREISGLKVYEQ